MLSKEPLWGYRMMTVLKDTYGVKVGPPTIYPLLGFMEEEALIEGEEVQVGRRKRKIYRTTEKGTEFVKCLESVVSEII
jgi:DNA-binding PadR family transcriptional regulator